MPTPYDRVPYPRHAYGFTHPDRLAALATLAGLEPAPIERARVLELGCAGGANLIPVAFVLPQAEFLGIDLSVKQIEDARRFTSDLKLSNILFEAGDLRDLDDSVGRFDYIVTHGLHSWVPREVQEDILRVCGGLLSERGVALISYNAYPGCHLRQIARGMARFHTRDIDEPTEKVAQAHAALRFLGDSLTDEYSVYRQIIRSEAERLTPLVDPFVLHDTLEDDNWPVYFHEFLEQAELHGLVYLDEAVQLDRSRTGLSAERLAELSARFDFVELEQHLDFFEGLSFRRTLVCRREQNPGRSPGLAELRRLRYTSQAVAAGRHDDEPHAASTQFTLRRGGVAFSMRVGEPLQIAALQALANAYPHALSFNELTTRAAGALDRSTTDDDERQIAELLLAGHRKNIVDVHVWQPEFVAELAARPTATRLARYQAAHGREVTTPWHERLHLGDPLSRHLVASLDGQRSVDELIEESVAFVLRMAEKNPSAAAPTRAAVEADLAPQIQRSLEKFAKSGILV